MLVLVADSHVVHGTESETSFFAMLEALSKTSHDILFLGDNLDLWIASGTRYENDSHRRFLAWCKAEKSRRKVIMVEGNHEFYVCRRHGDCFTACAEGVYRDWGMSFVHGDMAQHRFGFHRFFRAFAKNGFGDFVMSWLPFGVSFAAKMKSLLCHRKGRPDYLPHELVEVWMANEHSSSGNRRGFMGHFHCGGEGRSADGSWSYTILPAWMRDGQVGVLDTTTCECAIMPWQEALCGGK